MPSILFFGSFLDYSALVLKELHAHPDLQILGVVTTPPKPSGRDQALTPTPVQTTAETLTLPIFTPTKLDNIAIQTISQALSSKPDFLVVAGYGKLLPPPWLSLPKLAPINIHFSLLPKYRGAMPAEWALMMGETQTGVSLIQMSPTFDSGNLIATQSLPIKPSDTRTSLYAQLYPLGAELFLNSLPHFLGFYHNLKPKTPAHISFQLFLPPQPQPQNPPEPYARLLKREDSFVPWQLILSATKGTTQVPPDVPPLLQTLHKLQPQTTLPVLLERLPRALSGWPGVWTQVPTPKGTKRLKILSTILKNSKLSLVTVQLEGLSPTPFSEIKNQLLV